MMAPEYILILGSMLTCAAVLLFALFIGPVWDDLVMWHFASFVRRLQEISMDTSRVARWMRWWGVVLVGGFILLGPVLNMYLIAIAAVYIVYVAPKFIIDYLIARRRRLLRDQMVGACTSLANGMRAGLSLAQGLESLSQEVPQPLAAEFRRIVFEYHRGLPLTNALRDAKARLNLDGFTLFTSAILTALERGGRISDTLDRLSKSLQENQRLERKLEADTASGRKTVVVLGAFPFLFLLGFYAMDPDGVGLIFQTILGQLVFVVVLGIVYVGVKWAQRILAIKV